MLTNTVTRRLDIPHEPGQWIEIRMLSWKQLDDAREVRFKKVMDRLDGVDTSILPDVDNDDKGDDADEDAPYDRLTIFNAAVWEWTYEDEVSDTTLQNLDDVTAEWLEEEILALSTRKEEEKNDSSVS